MATMHPESPGDFPRLSNPPIVEASIDWRARAGSSFDESVWKAAFETELPDYSKVVSTQRVMAPRGPEGPMKMIVGPEGVHLSIPGQKSFAQATVDGMRFTMPQPYTHWQSFVEEAVRVWEAFCKIAQPIEVQRITLRYVNRFADVDAARVATILKDPPSCPADFALQDFTYQSTLRIPGEPYAARVVKHLPSKGPSGLILDISAFTLEPSEINDSDDLVRLRKLKNRVFFSLLTESEISKRGSL